MVQDHYNALLLITKKANEKIAVTPDFIRSINAAVMKQTGSIYQTVFGELDATKGVFRKGNVSAGSTYFVSYQKVEELVTKLCVGINQKLSIVSSVIEKLNYSFDAHFDLVIIHPFYDSNGRTCRLLMNYLQLYFNLPLSIVLKKIKLVILKRYSKQGKKRIFPSSKNLCLFSMQNTCNWKFKNLSSWILKDLKAKDIHLYFNKKQLLNFLKLSVDFLYFSCRCFYIPISIKCFFRISFLE